MALFEKGVVKVCEYAEHGIFGDGSAAESEEEGILGWFDLDGLVYMSEMDAEGCIGIKIKDKER